MRGFLLDTNVISEFEKPRPSTQVIEFVRVQPRRFLFTADLVLAELVVGAENVEDERRRRTLFSWIDDRVRPMFGASIVTTDERAFRLWARIVNAGRSKRITYSEPDTILAATAQSHDLIVATRDWKPFDRVGAPTLDPWKSLYRDGSGGAPHRVDLRDPGLLARLTAP